MTRPYRYERDWSRQGTWRFKVLNEHGHIVAACRHVADAEMIVAALNAQAKTS